MIHKLALLLAGWVALTPLADAQATPPAASPDLQTQTQELYAILQKTSEGQWIRVLTRNGGKIEGKLVRYDTGKVHLESDNIIGSIALSSVDAMWFKYRRSWTGALIGAGVGLGVGLVAGSAVTASCPDGDCSNSIGVMAVTGLVGGAVVGWVSGSAVPEWRLVFGPVTQGKLAAESAWAVPKTSTGGRVATAFLAFGYGAGTDANAPEGGTGGQIGLLVSLGPVVSLGPEIGYFDLGGGEDIIELAGQLRLSTTGARIRGYGLFAPGYYRWSYDQSAYGGAGNATDQEYLGYRVGLGGIWDVPRSALSVQAELSYHSELENVDAPRDLGLVTATIGAGVSW